MILYQPLLIIHFYPYEIQSHLKTETNSDICKMVWYGMASQLYVCLYLHYEEEERN